MFRALALVSLLCTSSIGLAQSPVAPGVETVASGGYWEANGRSGRYRIVVINQGFEHVTSRALVQWLAASKDGEPNIVATSELKPFGEIPASYTAQMKLISKGKLQITFTGVMPHEPTQKLRSVAIAEGPGQVKVMTANPLVQPTRKKLRAAN